MRILICGLGSIGQRHLRNLLNSSDKLLEIAAYRTRGFSLLISEDVQSAKHIDPTDHFNLKTFTSLEEAFNWKPDVTFITNPISKHLETAICAAQNRSHIFIEKPLSKDLSGVDELRSLSEKFNLKIMIGYQQRYHPALRFIKSTIHSGKLGKLTSSYFHFGEYLPNMHPYEDYSISHASRKAEGGGVIRCLSHEIDLVNFLFGFPTSVFCHGGKISNLDLNVEDCVNIMFNYTGDSMDLFTASVHLNFLQNPPQRSLQINGLNGSVIWDYYKKSVSLVGVDFDELHDFKDVPRNQQFEDEVSDFLRSINDDGDVSIPLQEGISVMRLCLAAEESMNKNSVVSL